MSSRASAGPVAVGILGTGTMAGIMAGALALAPRLRLVAVGSGSGERARAFADRLGGGVRAHGSREALLADPEVELVYVAGATARHAEDAIAALAAGKAVLVEKPLATSAGEAALVAAAAQAAGRFCMEAMWAPFLPTWVRLAELARSGEIGAPRHLSFSFGHPTTPEAEPRLFAPGPGGGVLLDHGIYGAALALRLLGPAARVEAAVERRDGVDVAAALQLAHAGGASAQIAVSLTALLPNAATLAATGGLAEIPAHVLGGETLRLSHAAPKPQARDGQPRGPAALVARARRVALLRRLRARRRAAGEWLGWGANMYLPMLAHVAQRVAGGARESDEMPLAASVAALDVLDRARRAGEGGR